LLLFPGETWARSSVFAWPSAIRKVDLSEWRPLVAFRVRPAAAVRGGEPITPVSYTAEL